MFTKVSWRCQQEVQVDHTETTTTIMPSELGILGPWDCQFGLPQTDAPLAPQLQTGRD